MKRVQRSKSQRKAFTLVELLVVIGIISLLVAVLFPALQRARQAAQALICSSNQRQIGLSLLMYSNDWKGAVIPWNPWNVVQVPPTPTVDTTPSYYQRDWMHLLWHKKYLKSVEVTRCPSDPIVSVGGSRHPFTFMFGPNDPVVLTNWCKAGYAYNAFGIGFGYGVVGTQSQMSYSVVSGNGWVSNPNFRDVHRSSESFWAADCTDDPNDLVAQYLYSYNAPSRHNRGLNVLWMDGHVTFVEGREFIKHTWAFQGSTPRPEWWWDPTRP